jgi:large subunit ribosomal protein L17
MVAALLTYERIRTTEVKAKEIRRLTERAITWARRLGPILTKKPEKRSEEERARVVHAIRMALRVVRDRDAVMKLFEEIGPRLLARHGGYTRIIKLAQRPGDAAPMVYLEIIPGEGDDAAKATSPKGKEPAKAKAKGKEKAAAGADAGEPKPKAKTKTKATAAPKAKSPARAPAKSAATMKRSGRGGRSGSE